MRTSPDMVPMMNKSHDCYFSTVGCWIWTGIVPTMEIMKELCSLLFQPPFFCPSSSTFSLLHSHPIFCSPLPLFFPLQVAGEDSDEEDEQYTAADTYTNYRPAKCKYLHSLLLLFPEMVIVMGKECIVLVGCIYCSWTGVPYWTTGTGTQHLASGFTIASLCSFSIELNNSGNSTCLTHFADQWWIPSGDKHK